MGVYRVTDPQTGVTVKMTGSSEPTEQEIIEAFSSMGIDASTPQQQTSSYKPVPENFSAESIVRAPERVAALREQRPNMAQRTLDMYRDARPESIRDVLEYMVKPSKMRQAFAAGGKGALMTAGAVGQAVEGAIAGPVTAMQEGRFAEIGNEIYEGLSGESKAEFGDILREVGAPETVARVGGLLMAAGINPEARLAQAGRALVNRATVKLALSGLSKATKKGAMRVLLRDNPRRAGYIVANDFDMMSPSKLTNVTGRAQKLANEIVDETDRLVYQPASRAWDELGEGVLRRKVSQQTATRIGDSVSSELDLLDEVALDKLLRTKVSGSAKFGAQPGKGWTLDELLRASGSGVTTDVGDWHQAIKILRRIGKDDVNAHQLVRAISEPLAGEVTELRRANALWRNWTDTMYYRDQLLGKATKGGKHFVEGRGMRTRWIAKDEAVGRIKRILDSPEGGELDTYISKLDGYIRHAKRLGSYSEEAPQYAKKLYDMSATIPYESIKPGLTAISIGGGAGVALSKLGVPPAMTAAVALGTLAESTPKVSALTGRAFFGTARRASKTPLAKTLKGILGPGGGLNYMKDVTGVRSAAMQGSRAIMDEALGRQFTGRNTPQY